MGPAQARENNAPALAFERMPTFAFAALLFAIVFLLRIFYAGYVWADEGLWFTAANELLRGKQLYSQIWFDKPPAVAWVYAALFRLAGPSVPAVRLFTIVYAGAICLALWHLGRRFWGEREGRLAALLYALYNATYIHSQVQPLAVDQLVLLPYLYSGYFFLAGNPIASGLLAAVAFSLNPKAAALFPFFALITVSSPARRQGAPRAWSWLFLGFMAGVAPWLAYLLHGGKWQWYVRDFWEWGMRYVSVYSPAEMFLNGLRRTFNYAGFHLALVLGLVMLFWGREPGQGPTSQVPGPKSQVPSRKGHSLWTLDFGLWTHAPTGDAATHALLWWLAFSFLGVAAGGRFFPRYFYQMLPLLCLLAAKGYVQSPRSKVQSRAGQALRVLFWVAVAFALVRFHHRAVFLAYEQLTGRPTAYMAAWKDPAIDQDSRRIAARVHGSLFVWGYRPEIYFYCGCPAASAYLSDQPLTGVPADVHLTETRNVAPESAAENRARLIEELRRSPPAYIVDGIGPYNPALAITRYPELNGFLEANYREVEEVGKGVIYARK